MSIIGDLTDAITGGANQKAEADLQAALARIGAVSTPTADELKLSPLAPYVMTGELSPAEMQGAEAGPSAFERENLSSVPMETMQEVLAREREIAGANGMTPQEQAAIAQAEDTVNRNTAGQRGAINADFAQRGVPASLIAAALENGTVGSNAQNEMQAALTARANAANEGLTALSNEGNLAGAMFDKNAGQANTVAAAQDALARFNASNSQAARTTNAANEMAANTYNTTTAQNIGNENVTGEHQVQIQNQVEAPQEAARLALEKANAEAGVGEAQAGQQTAVGQQNAGLFGGLIGAGATLGSGAMSANATNNLAGAIRTGGYAEGGDVPPKALIPAVNFKGGGPVPGKPRVAGDSPANDTVPAKLSPGEFVVPRTAMARPEVRSFLANNVPTPRPPAVAHPSDVASILKALAMLRGAPEAA